MGDKQYPKTRQYYRIRYPYSYRPKLRIQDEGYDCDVLELSERGARFTHDDPSQLIEGADVHVEITFYDGESFQFDGDILRVGEKDVIVRFTESLPMNRMMMEQRYMRDHIIGYM